MSNNFLALTDWRKAKNYLAISLYSKSVHSQNLIQYIHHLCQPFTAVEEFLFLGGEFDLASYGGVYSVIVAEADAVTGEKFRPSLAYDNIARFCHLAIVQLNS